MIDLNQRIDHARADIHAVAERMEYAANLELAEMAKQARASINRSVGQHQRWQRAGIEQFKRESAKPVYPKGMFSYLALESLRDCTFSGEPK